MNPYIIYGYQGTQRLWVEGNFAEVCFVYRKSHQNKLNGKVIKHPAASSEVLKALFRLLVFNQPSPQGARN
jgi:hypothetical protein